MSIPKIIFQTYKHHNLSLVTKFMVGLTKWRNPNYQYEFYDDARIESFLKKEFPSNVFEAYAKLDIGAAKADFFRYAVLYKYGGVYLDIDGYAAKSLDKIILADDDAIITKEKHEGLYAQFALIYGKGHAIMKRCVEKMCYNIENNLFANDIHQLTGPTLYSDAVRECIKEGIAGNYRIWGQDYNGVLKPKYWMHGGVFTKRERWKKVQKERPAIRQS